MEPVVAITLGIYFIPAIVAAFKQHHNQTAIFFLNMFLGWTFIGWVAALVWAVSRPSSAIYIRKE